MKVIEIEGKSVDDAKKKAAASLGITFSELKDENVEVLDEGKSGIFGFGVSKPAKIRVSYNVVGNDIGEQTKEMLFGILERMGITASVDTLHEGANKVYIELVSKNSGLIIGKKGKTLEALQFLLNLMVSNKLKTDKKIILDIESYRSKRERALKKLSRDMARKVAMTGRPYTLEPMNPFERRLVHLTLQNDKSVTTRSEGEGIYRQVKIFPR